MKRRMIAIAIAVFAVIAACAAMGLGIADNTSAGERYVCDSTVVSAELTEYDGKVEHIFTHELIFDTDKAFSYKNSLRDSFDKDHLTAKEFKALLGELYKNNYVLVGLDDVIGGESLLVPRGKKPLVMSFDDLSYDTRNRGFIDKLIIENGKICDYTKNSEPQVTRERENVTILENFIEQHPDFSPTGARATLCVNGYNGILGYRCTPDSNVPEGTQAAERAACKKLVSALKELGYTFASHTYYHKYFNSCSESMIEKDCAAWRKYIEPIVGKTRVLCYPAGDHNAKSAKNDIFKSYGFDVFLCVGNSNGTEYERTSLDAKYIYRLPFDGTALRLYEKTYAHIVDTRAIYDEARVCPFSYKGTYFK